MRIEHDAMVERTGTSGPEKVDELNQYQKARRTVLKLGLATSGLLIMEGIRRFLTFQERQPGPVQVVLEYPEAYKVGSTIAVPEVNCWLLRDGSGFYALTRACPHLGCQVNKEDTSFTCPCHGSKFATDGTVVHGPAGQALGQVQVSQSSDGRLVVDAGVTVEAGTRLTL